MKKGVLAAGAMFALAATAMAGNYAFPSPWNPAGKASKDINQWATIIWDDNQYSGAGGSYYEPQAGSAYGSVGRVDGIRPQANPTDTWTAINNPLNIFSSGKGKDKYGLAWALENIGKERSKPIPQTFNMITGLFVNVWVDKEVPWSENPTEGVSWQRYQSALGYWTGQEMGTNLPDIGTDADYYPVVPDKSGYVSVAVAWGREMRSGINPAATSYAQQNFITEMVQKIVDAGIHEIGNHTIDHMETNSILGDGQGPRAGKPGFSTITGGDLSRGMSTPYAAGRTGDEMSPWGVVYNQVDEYGTKGHALIRGWAINVGHWMEQDVWKNYIKLSEDWLTKAKNDKEGGLGYPQSKVRGFRAPRLEVNSAMFYALKELNYLYDCGLEEGYEEHVDGYNFLWPYTTDNGQRNSWTHMNIGERVFIDTMPVGLWEIPVNCFIVPKGQARDGAVDHWNQINNGKTVKDAPMVASEWNGKITGFDFNMWVIYGMDKNMFLETMKTTLDRRLAGNKAPLQYGAHTDYYTPIYDNGTLLNDFNKNNYGLNITKGWNTWKIRQQGTEEWVDYALSKGVIFLTGQALIDSLSAMNAAGEARINDTKVLSDAEFVGYVDGKEESGLGKFNGATGITDKEFSAAVDIEKNPTYIYEFDAGKYPNLTHISLDYKSRTATSVKLIMEDDSFREVILAHRYSPIGTRDGQPSDSYERGSLRNSGKIPLTSFDFDQGYDGVRNYSAIDPAKIVAIEITPLAPEAKTPVHGQELDDAWWNGGSDRKEPYGLKYTFKNITLYSGEKFNYDEDDLPDLDVGIEAVKTNGRVLALAGISANALRLNIATAGKYDVKVFGVNGRLLQSFNAQSLTAGINTLKLNNLAKGVYLIKIQGINTKQQLTKSAVVL